MLSKSLSIVLIASAILSFSLEALSQRAASDTSATRTESAGAADRLTQNYTEFAGSADNAKSLVSGLRNSTEVTLSSASATSTSFTPPTGKMGYGSVNISLALAQAQLSDFGITNPTPKELQAALTGGTIASASADNVQLSGILTMRAEGKGWGQIAQALGFKLGELMRSPNGGTGSDRIANREKPERAEKPLKPERPEKPDRSRR